MGNKASQKEIDAIKDLVCGEVDARASMLIEASHAIHANPELNFEEHFAHELLTGLLEDEGLSPTRNAMIWIQRLKRRRVLLAPP